MILRIPYRKIELQLALISLRHIGFSDEKILELESELNEDFPADEAALDEKAAAYHGKTVDELRSNPDFATLRGEYALNVLEKLVPKMMEKFGITEKQSWAVIARLIGLL